MTAREIMSRWDLQITVGEPEATRPDDASGEWPKDSKHYEFSIGLFKGDPANNITGYYSQGPGVKNLPVNADILEAVIRDAQCALNAVDLADFLVEYGYAGPEVTVDTVRRGIECYNECGRFLSELINLLGEEAVDLILMEFEED